MSCKKCKCDRICSRAYQKLGDVLKLFVAMSVGIVFGAFVGIAFSRYGLISTLSKTQATASNSGPGSRLCSPPRVIYQNYSRGAELLPPKIIVPETDLYMRRLWGMPEEDLPFKAPYLVTFTVGFAQREIINAAVSKFSSNWTIVLFHYDGRASEWEQFEWAQNVIHISARKQSKWWFAKRFLHPDVIAPFEYIFVWDEDLGLENFDAEEYIKVVKKHELEISQPALEPKGRVTWRMTMRRPDLEVHRKTTESLGRCKDPTKPPCMGFVEIMAPVFSKVAWKCVWHMIQNDLIHGWGLDFVLGRCVKIYVRMNFDGMTSRMQMLLGPYYLPPYMKIGIVDSQWIVHKSIPSLGSQGESIDGKAPRAKVGERCNYEFNLFHQRLEEADKEDQNQRK